MPHRRSCGGRGGRGGGWTCSGALTSCGESRPTDARRDLGHGRDIRGNRLGQDARARMQTHRCGTGGRAHDCACLSAVCSFGPGRTAEGRRATRRWRERCSAGRRVRHRRLGVRCRQGCHCPQMGRIAIGSLARAVVRIAAQRFAVPAGGPWVSGGASERIWTSTPRPSSQPAARRYRAHARGCPPRS
jgi:hypothetical protein